MGSGCGSSGACPARRRTTENEAIRVAWCRGASRRGRANSRISPGVAGSSVWWTGRGLGLPNRHAQSSTSFAEGTDLRPDLTQSVDSPSRRAASLRSARPRGNTLRFPLAIASGPPAIASTATERGETGPRAPPTPARGARPPWLPLFGPRSPSGRRAPPTPARRARPPWLRSLSVAQPADLTRGQVRPKPQTVRVLDGGAGGSARRCRWGWPARRRPDGCRGRRRSGGPRRTRRSR